MNYRRICGEYVTKDSWVMRDLWNAAKLPQKEEAMHIEGTQRLVTEEIEMLKVVLYLMCRNNRRRS
jgi:hypothetical protein